MAKLTITPPPVPVERVFTLVLSEAEALHIWAALGPSSDWERQQYIIRNAPHIIRPASNKSADDVYGLLDDVFAKVT